jgi:four helix bundle protein
LEQNKVLGFEDLTVWKKSMSLTKEVYDCLRNCRDYGFRDQIQRACVSIPSNIAEGYERIYNKEKIRFYSFAKGSCGEVRTQLYLAKFIGFIDVRTCEKLIQDSTEISSMLFSLIDARKTKFK